ncbi:response regulator [Ningiella sp. W23]|uniref:response regulator n=1 Tax=Ningiella sp. W23 TaxID=3023715 RepID=UPI0037581B73
MQAELAKKLSTLNILIVDDMAAIRGLTKTLLESMGATKVDDAIDGADAWKKLNQRSYDIIISDWDMPKCSGIQLLEKVRDSIDYQRTPFLLLTASNEKSRVISAVKMGVSDYLSKPFQPHELEQRVARMLEKMG